VNKSVTYEDKKSAISQVNKPDTDNSRWR